MHQVHTAVQTVVKERTTVRTVVLSLTTVCTLVCTGLNSDVDGGDRQTEGQRTTPSIKAPSHYVGRAGV